MLLFLEQPVDDHKAGLTAEEDYIPHSDIPGWPGLDEKDVLIPDKRVHAAAPGPEANGRPPLYHLFKKDRQVGVQFHLGLHGLTLAPGEGQ